MTVYTEKTIPSGGVEFVVWFLGLPIPLGASGAAYAEVVVPTVTYGECIVPTTVSTECAVPTVSYTEKSI